MKQTIALVTRSSARSWYRRWPRAELASLDPTAEAGELRAALALMAGSVNPGLMPTQRGN